MGMGMPLWLTISRSVWVNREVGGQAPGNFAALRSPIDSRPGRQTNGPEPNAKHQAQWFSPAVSPPHSLTSQLTAQKSLGNFPAEK